VNLIKLEYCAFSLLNKRYVYFFSKLVWMQQGKQQSSTNSNLVKLSQPFQL